MTRYIASMVAIFTVGGCYAELEDKSVTITRAMPICDANAPSCAFEGISAVLQVPTPIAAAGATDFTLDLGDEDVLKAERKLGPVELKGNLKLNRAVLVATTPGASFSGVQRLDLVQLPFSGVSSSFDPCATLGACRSVATYDRDQDDPADDKLVLRGTGANLLELAGSQVTLRFVARGVLPTAAWNADLSLETEYKARASYP